MWGQTNAFCVNLGIENERKFWGKVWFCLQNELLKNSRLALEVTPCTSSRRHASRKTGTSIAFPPCPGAPFRRVAAAQANVLLKQK